jgi:hypothetical protein
MSQRVRYLVGACVGLALVATGLLLWVSAPKAAEAIVSSMWAGVRARQASTISYASTAIATTGRWMIYSGLVLGCAVVFTWVVRGNGPADRA